MERLRQEWTWTLDQLQGGNPIWTHESQRQETLVLYAEETQRWQAEETFRHDVEQFARQIIETSGGITKTVLIRRFGQLIPLAEIHAPHER
jgi:hypothetical protein